MGMGVGYSRRAMTTPAPDPDAEREVDLARWRRAVVRLWWLPVGGLVLGAIVGGLYSLRGGTDYKASALISLGQPVSPGGALVNGFYSNPRAIALITSSASAQSGAEAKAGLASGALRGHVSVAQVGSTTGAGATRSCAADLADRSGRQPGEDRRRRQRARDGRRETHDGAVRGHEDRDLPHRPADDEAAARLDQRPDHRRRRGDQEGPARPDQQARDRRRSSTRRCSGRATCSTSCRRRRQQLAFSQNVESAKVITDARSVKSSAHSRSSSILIGALIGLLLGGIAAVIGDSRIG